MSSIRAERNHILQFDQLAMHNRIIRYDARGHGLSSASTSPSDYEWTQLGNDMVSIARSLDVDRFVAGGASMGCATSLYAAIQAPDRIRGLVLVIPPTAWDTRAPQASLYEDMANFTEVHSPEDLVAMQAATPRHWSSDSTPDEQLETLRSMYNALPTVLRGAKLSDFPDRDVLKQLHMPSIILCWTDDPGHPVSTAEELHRLLPNSSLTVASNREEMATWTDQVAYFLRETVR